MTSAHPNEGGVLHQPANPLPVFSVPSHPRVWSFHEVCWSEPTDDPERSRWRVGRVGDANRERVEVFPDDGGHVLVFVGKEIDELRVRPSG